MPVVEMPTHPHAARRSRAGGRVRADAGVRPALARLVTRLAASTQMRPSSHLAGVASAPGRARSRARPRRSRGGTSSVPRAHDVVAVERAVAERAADVVAGAGDRPEPPLAVAERDLQVARLDLLEWSVAQRVDRAEVVPAGRIHSTTWPRAAAAVIDLRRLLRLPAIRLRSQPLDDTSGCHQQPRPRGDFDRIQTHLRLARAR